MEHVVHQTVKHCTEWISSDMQRYVIICRDVCITDSKLQSVLTTISDYLTDMQIVDFSTFMLHVLIGGISEWESVQMAWLHILFDGALSKGPCNPINLRHPRDGLSSPSCTRGGQKLR